MAFITDEFTSRDSPRLSVREISLWAQVTTNLVGNHRPKQHVTPVIHR